MRPSPLRPTLGQKALLLGAWGGGVGGAKQQLGSNGILSSALRRNGRCWLFFDRVLAASRARDWPWENALRLLAQLYNFHLQTNSLLWEIDNVAATLLLTMQASLYRHEVRTVNGRKTTTKETIILNENSPNYSQKGVNEVFLPSCDFLSNLFSPHPFCASPLPHSEKALSPFWSSIYIVP